MSWLEILAVIGIIGFVIYQQLAGQLLQGKRLVVLPAVVTVIGFLDLRWLPSGAGRHRVADRRRRRVAADRAGLRPDHAAGVPRRRAVEEDAAPRPVAVGRTVRRDGRPPHPDTITWRFKKLAVAAGLPEIDLHDVRHRYATAGRDAKIDWKALSKRMGHKSDP